MTHIEYSGRDNLDVMKAAIHYNQFLVDMVLNAMPRQGSVVDFGAGAGTFAQPVRAAGLDVVCVETDPVLGNNLHKLGMSVVTDLQSVADASLSGIYSLNVLEHIEDDQAILDLWMRKLAPGGQILVYVPAFQSLYSSMDRKVGHHRRYRRAGLQQQLHRAGFEVQSVRYADSLGYLASWVYKLMDKGHGDINSGMLRTYDQWVFPVSRLLDGVCQSWFGKNVYATACKPATPLEP